MHAVTLCPGTLQLLLSYFFLFSCRSIFLRDSMFVVCLLFPIITLILFLIVLADNNIPHRSYIHTHKNNLKLSDDGRTTELWSNAFLTRGNKLDNARGE